MNRKWMSILLSVVLAAGLFGVLPAPRALAAATYTWNQTGSASWAVSTNWTPTRTTPATDDILQFNGGGTVTVTNIPTQTIGQLLLSNSSTVGLQANAASTVLTIGGGTGADLDAPSGSALNIDGTNAMTIFLAAGATGSVSGNMTFSSAAHKLNANDASAITFNSGATLTQSTGCTGNIFTNAGTANVIVFASGATLEQAVAASNPFGLGQPNSKVVFQTGSLYKHSNNNTPSFSGRTYANFELNNGNVFSVSGTAAVSIDNLTITAGTLNFNMTGTPGHSIKGNISVASGQTLNFNPASAGTVTLNGTSTQTISGSGTFSTQSNSTLAINNAAGVTISKDLTINGTLTLTSGLLTLGTNTLTLGSAASIGGTPSASNMVVADGSGTLCKTHAGTGSFTFPIGDNTGTAEYSPVALNVTALTGSGNICFNLVDAVYPNKLAGANDYITRYWVGSKAAGITALTYNATFTYVDADVVGTESVMAGKKWNGALPWTTLGNVDTGLNTFVGSSLTTFSDFTAFNRPLAAPLSSLDAMAAAGRIVLAWETTSELGSQGYHVYRADAAGGGWTRLNAAMIPSQAPGSPSGYGYRYDDASTARGTAYRYRLAAVGMDGQETSLDAVQVTTPYWLWLPAAGR